MSNLIDAIIQTKKTAEQIALKCLANIDNLSEVEIREKILTEVENHNELFPLGWYDPPIRGEGILLAEEPFERLKFESLRDPISWPKEDEHFKKDTVGMIYFSPVDKKTKMIGDFGLTVYKGDNQEIKEHIKKCYDVVLSIAKYSKVGMKFSDLYNFTENLFKKELKIVGWMTTTSDPNLGVNLGHTIPGSFEKDFVFGDSFEEVKNTIRTKRIYINKKEDFIIPETCAFTVEARLADINRSYLPNTFFHFIVCFDKGKKTILENYDNIFNMVGMDYMNLRHGVDEI